MESAAIADVVVVGGGGSALAAAAEAAALGRSVVLLEKNAKLGGSTAWSVGSYSATNTPHQRRAGVQDSPDEHFEDLGKFAGALEPRDNLALRRVLVDNATDTFRWLEDAGLVFLGPALEPPHRHPRMHNVVPTSKAYPYHLGRLCRRLRVDVRLSTRAQRLVVEQGRVVGVVAIGADGGERIYRARRGVVLATGDFSGGRELKARYASPLAATSDAVNVTNTGDGHAMALELGARVVNGDLVHGPIMRFVPPLKPSLVARIPPYTIVGRAATLAMAHAPKRLIRPVLMSFVTTALGPDPGLYRAGARLVNGRGARFTDELAKPALDLVAQPDGIGYIVLDGAIAAQFSAWPNFVSTAPNVAYAYLPDYKRNRPDVYHEARDVPSLASKLGMDAASLARSLDAIDGRPALSKPPFIALGPVKSYVVLTEGGLAVSERHEVLGSGDAPIPGLFAAGSTGQGGLLLYGHGHHLAWAFVSGRRAGRYAALLAPA
jgi:succinate dehydrogenase/fumarate reductase flavoprotein subunit